MTRGLLIGIDSGSSPVEAVAFDRSGAPEAIFPIHKKGHHSMNDVWRQLDRARGKGTANG